MYAYHQYIIKPKIYIIKILIVELLSDIIVNDATQL